MRKLLIYMKDYKKESFLAPLFKLLEASFDLIVPLIIAQIINVGIANRDKGYILVDVRSVGYSGYCRACLRHYSSIFCR